MIKYISIFFTIILAILFLVLFYTDPASAGPVGILAVFVLIYMIFLVIISYLILFTIKTTNKLRKHFGLKHTGDGPSLYNSFLYGSVIALGMIVLLGRNSLGSVGLFESILVITFVLIGCFFVNKQVVK